MPKEPVSVIQIKEILRLRLVEGVPERMTAAHCGVSKGAVGDYTRRAVELGLTWADVEPLSESELWRLFGKRAPTAPTPGKRMPDYEQVYLEKRRSGATLDALWREYVESDPDTAYQYTQFCQYYHEYVRTLDVRMRRERQAGEELFVDYSGKKLPVWKPGGEEIAYDAEIFVAAIGCSGLLYAEATRTQNSEDWNASHESAFRYAGGVPRVWVPDNLKAAVDKAGHAPVINRSYLEHARHHGAIVQPARVRKARDKALVENGVLQVQRWILFALRNVKFYDLESMNTAIRTLVDLANDKPLRNLPYTRRQLFNALDRPALLPYRPGYSHGHFSKAKVNPQYCVRVLKKYYSVPYQLVGKVVDVRASAMTVEMYYDGQRIAIHNRLHGDRLYSIKREHMPPNHAAMQAAETEKVLSWARQIGPRTESYIADFIGRRREAFLAHGQAKGVLLLAKVYGNARLEAACALAHSLQQFRRDYVEALLRRGRDKRTTETTQLALPQDHPNIRGGDYYN